MIHKRIVHHFVPHRHENIEHRAHGIGLVSLFSYLQIFLIVAAGFWLIKTKAPQILGTASFSPGQIITLTNQKRTENGLGTLSENSLLDAAAHAKATNMFSENYWAHNSPSGNTPWTFITAAGYHYVFAGENLARNFDDPKSVVDAWMNSPTHRSNLLDKNFKEIGVAVEDGSLQGKDGILVVQMFGSAITQVQSQPQASNNLPATSPSPAASVVPAPTSVPAQAVQGPTEQTLGQENPDNGAKPTVLASRQFSIARGISLALVSFIFLLFAVEVVITVRRDNLSLRAGVLAHLGILAFLLFAIWYAVGGAIL